MTFLGSIQGYLLLMTHIASPVLKRYPHRLQAGGVLRQGGVTGLILVSRLDLLGFY